MNPKNVKVTTVPAEIELAEVSSKYDEFVPVQVPTELPNVTEQTVEVTLNPVGTVTVIFPLPSAGTAEIRVNVATN